MTDVDGGREGPARRVGRRATKLIIAGLVAALTAGAVKAALAWSSKDTAEFDHQSIVAATQAADVLSTVDPKANTYINVHLDNERLAGRDITLAQIQVAVLDKGSGDHGRVYLVWSGSRSPTKLLIVSHRRLGGQAISIGFTASASAVTPASPNLDRAMRGGGTGDGRMTVRTSDCIEAWYEMDDEALRMSSCTELWRSGDSQEWLYHQFANAVAPANTTANISGLAIRARTQQATRPRAKGPTMVLSCSDESMTFYAQAENVNGTPTNPALRVPPNSCHGYQDLINAGQTQLGARNSSEGPSSQVSTTGSYRISADVTPAFEDYFWVETGSCQWTAIIGCRTPKISEADYVRDLW